MKQANKQTNRGIRISSRMLLTFTLLVGAWAGVAWQLDALDQYGPASLTAQGIELVQSRISYRVDQLNGCFAQFNAELKHAYINGMM